MAKLVLKFENTVQKEVALLEGVVTIGRLADNTLQIDSPGVSSQHCRVAFEDGHYVVEDSTSTNGTFVNKQRVARVQLIHGDELTIGKHTIAFVDTVGAGPGTRHADAPAARIEKTVMFDARQAQDMLASIKTGIAAAVPADAVTPITPKERVGTLTVLHGKTDQPHYVLTRKLLMIGKSDTAAIRLKGFFAPKSAAVINRRQGKYFVAPAEKSVKIKINEAHLAAPQELNEGDILEVASVRMTFSYDE